MGTQRETERAQGVEKYLLEMAEAVGNENVDPDDSVGSLASWRQSVTELSAVFGASAWQLEEPDEIVECDCASQGNAACVEAVEAHVSQEEHLAMANKTAKSVRKPTDDDKERSVGEKEERRCEEEGRRCIGDKEERTCVGERVTVGESTHTERRTYTRPWSAHTVTGRGKRSARPASAVSAQSARTQPETRKAQANDAEASRKKEKKREQGWNERFGVNESDHMYHASQQRAPKPTHFVLSKEQMRKKSNTVSNSNGKMLPWLDPNKQIKRKPIVACAPFMRKQSGPAPRAKTRATSLNA